MKFTNEKLESSRNIVRAQQTRVDRQRQMIEAARAARHPLDDLQARLLVMEQSLLSMKRFLSILERDLEMSLGIHRPRRQTRAKAKQPESDAGAEDEPGSTDTR